MRNDFCSDYLEHAAQRQNHKYIAREPNPKGGWLYFYTQAQLQAYHKGKAQGQFAKSDPYAEARAELAKVAASRIKAKSKKTTVAEAKKELAKVTAKSDSSSKKSKKSGSGSKKSSSKKSKGASSSGSSKSKSGKSSEAKAKASTTAKAASQNASATDAKKMAELQKNYNKLLAKYKFQLESRALKNSKQTIETLKINNKIKDNDVTKHANTAKLMEDLNTKEDGAYGYIQAGTTAYKWAKQGGKVVIKSLDGKNNVTLDPNLRNIESFRADKKKKK